MSGLDWIDDLVKEGKAVDLGDDGYPMRYTVQAEHVRGRLAEPPHARPVWHLEPGDIPRPGWAGKTTVHEETTKACEPDECC